MNKPKKTHYYKPSAKTPKFSVTQKIIIAIIVIVMLIVTIATILFFALKDNSVVKSKIEYLAKDYYENYLYEKYTTPGAEGLEKYEKAGLSSTPLRQIIYHGEASDDDIAQISNACDENRTYIKYYPEPPYTKTSYRIEYTYVCEE